MTIDINGLTSNSNSGKPKNLESNKSNNQAASSHVAQGPAVSEMPPQSKGNETEQLSVELSGAGKLMQKLEDNISQQPDVDEKRVAHFKELISNNAYKVDAKTLADNIIASDNLF